MKTAAMDDRPLLILVGGFLGAGKTTLLDRAARALAREGRRVRLITNDQSTHLVDTERLRTEDRAVEEVAVDVSAANLMSWKPLPAACATEDAR